MTLSWPLPMTPLSSGTLQLVPWNNATTIPGIVDDLAASCQDPRMVEYTTVPTNYTTDMAKQFLATEAVRWALVVGQRYCGTIELRVVNKDFAHVDVGYATAPWARGKGLMTTALGLVRDYCFEHGVFRLEAKAAVDNAASRHVIEQNGFLFEGIQRGGEIIRGNVHDIAVYALLSSDVRGE